MSNSSELITLRDMVRDLPSIYRRLCDGDWTMNEYREFLRDLFEIIDRALDNEGSLTSTRESENDQEAEEALTTLKVARAHRNSLMFQGGDFDLYLSCQDPWSALPGQTGWGEWL
jgi:hypothetical protein